jgi:curved DNA-binding protein
MAVAFRDYYDTLGVDRGASEDEIRRAYRKLARENHPDVNKDPDAEDRFKAISEAYEVLRDPEKRKAYDRFGENWKAGQNVSDADFRDFDFGGRGGGAQQGGFRDVRVDFGDGDGFSDFFESFFGRGGATRRARSAGAPPGGGFGDFSLRGGDQEAEIELSLEEAFRGGRRKISLADGRDYEITIPPGVRDGQRIRLAGEGEPGTRGGPSGDLFLRVRIRPDKRFRREGQDLYVDLPVTPWEAALGASVEVPTLEGRHRVKVPAGSSSDRRLRLREQGMPDSRGRRGDLYAVVKIVAPKRLTREERELFERLAEVSHFNPRERS